MAEVVTGEAVVLEVPCARFPSRLLALIIDVTIQIVTLSVLAVVAARAEAGAVFDPASAAAVGVTSFVLVIVGYPVIWETCTRGRTPGKYALGLRVVSDDGGPERFRQALVRGLAAAVEIWLLLGSVALICSLLSSRGKRLGDLFAGTFVIQQRLPARRSPATYPMVPPQLAAWAAGLEMSGLNERTAETARRYLARAPELTPAARAAVGERIAADVRAQVTPQPPPGVPVEYYLATVLAERRNREHARLTGYGRGPAGYERERGMTWQPQPGSTLAYGAPGAGPLPGSAPVYPSAGGPPSPQGTPPGTTAAEEPPAPGPPARPPGGFVPPA